MSTNEWSGRGWRVTLNDTEMTLALVSDVVTIPSIAASTLEVRRRWSRWSLRQDGRLLAHLLGMTRREASALRRALRGLALGPAIADAVAWHGEVVRVLTAARAEQRWVTTEAVDALLGARPEPGLLGRVRAAGYEEPLTEGQLEAVSSLDADLEELVTLTNEEVMAAELSSRKTFFDAVEKSPLTEEQARAVVCFDNRAQVLAAAGSGKTSVMVARAAYAVSRGLVAPERILLLAFNKAAATELQERISARFAAAGISSSGVRASTFHSFGLDVIGRATGEKPRLAGWLDQGEDVQMVLRIVDELRGSSESFRYRWDLYRLLFANATARTSTIPTSRSGTSTGPSAGTGGLPPASRAMPRTWPGSDACTPSTGRPSSSPRGPRSCSETASPSWKTG